MLYLLILSVPGRDWMYQWKNGWEKGGQSVKWKGQKGLYK